MENYLENKEGWIPITNGLDPRINYNYLVDEDGWNPIHYAVTSKQMDMIKVLAPLIERPNNSGPNGHTPIAFAATLGLVDIINFLAPLQEFPNLPDNDGFTPIFMAAARGHASVIWAFEDFNPHLSGYNGYDDSITDPLLIANLMGHQKCIEALMALRQR